MAKVCALLSAFLFMTVFDCLSCNNYDTVLSVKTGTQIVECQINYKLFSAGREGELIIQFLECYAFYLSYC